MAGVLAYRQHVGVASDGFLKQAFHRMNGDRRLTNMPDGGVILVFFNLPFVRQWACQILMHAPPTRLLSRHFSTSGNL